MQLANRMETKLQQSPRLYQQMNILGMSSQELEAYVNELSMENPLIELPALRPSASSSGSASSYSGEFSDLPLADECPYTLKTDLEEQLLSMKLDKRMERALKLLIINLDQRGYLPDYIAQTFVWKGCETLFEDALSILHGMEPAGVGARDLSECLRLQLARMGEADSCAYAICDGYLEHLGKCHINLIARELNVSEAEVNEARKRIASLNPIPSNGYDGGAGSVPIVPDVEIVSDGGTFGVRLNDTGGFNCQISAFYRNMLESDTITPQERAYFEAKLKQAQWVMSAIEQRRETLMQCAAALLTEQKTFFETGVGLKPCSMSAVAQRIGVHLSTVSRTVKSKYLACKWGTFPLGDFFAHNVNGSSADSVADALRQIIAQENPDKPLSDSRLCEELARRGYSVARRTVAKYREQANIPPATGRKKR